jgi:bifunctional non-homologous end joining protein LigD
VAAVKATLPKKRLSRKDSDSTPPSFRPFQLATLQRTVPTGDAWLFEMKHDGYRAQAAIAAGQVRIYSRGGHDWTNSSATWCPRFRS